MLSGRYAAVLAALALATAASPGRSEPSNRLLLGAPGAGQRALATVRQLARERPAGSAGEAVVARIVAGRLRSLGYRVVEQPFRLPRGGMSRNVVANGGGPTKVVIVAHLDGVLGTVAANDNASGVAVLLELARALAGREGVLFAALGAEERVVTRSRLHLGSSRLTVGLSRRARRLAVSIDMAGVGTRLYVRGLESRPNVSARALLAHGGTYLRDPGDSDHAELTRAGIPAAWVQWRRDACWHAPCDRPGRVDARKLQAAYDLVHRAATLALKSR
jgi:aminopeptidase YwaD